MEDITDTAEYRIAAMKRFIEKSREGISEVEAKIREIGGEVEEEVTLEKMFEFMRWKDDNGFEYNPRKGFWFLSNASLPHSLLMYSDSDLWKKYQEDKKPKI